MDYEIYGIKQGGIDKIEAAINDYINAIRKAAPEGWVKNAIISAKYAAGSSTMEAISQMDDTITKKIEEYIKTIDVTQYLSEIQRQYSIADSDNSEFITANEYFSKS